ncbi:hypothetical protein SAMN05660690_3136 [Geodermatophilus telluris]|uniref:Uncharacterized protein n=1 Tax=Geodermatophilus telluris TaxID=1190417 RepID=A0A1G6QWV6_9ACTN|nr:hypothetical protein [Geodermatophilus telluris]SDC96761.1 hypothetical protein SAMN05660690_3136 [Geodermatophilus telluris]
MTSGTGAGEPLHVTDEDGYLLTEEIVQARARILRARVLGGLRRLSLVAAPALLVTAALLPWAVRTLTPVWIVLEVAAAFAVLLVCLTNGWVSGAVRAVLEVPEDIVEASQDLAELEDEARRRRRERRAHREASERHREESAETRRRAVLKDITRVRDRWERSGRRLFRLLFACQTAVILASGVAALFPGSDWWNRALVAVPGFLTAFTSFGKFGEKSTVYSLGGAQLRYEIASHDLEVGDYAGLDGRARLDRLVGTFHGLQLEVQNGTPALPDVPVPGVEGADGAAAAPVQSTPPPRTVTAARV